MSFLLCLLLNRATSLSRVTQALNVQNVLYDFLDEKKKKKNRNKLRNTWKSFFLYQESPMFIISNMKTRAF